ncbi:MAG: ABC transporter permease [Candidatus Bathyarchaeia archaeon]
MRASSVRMKKLRFNLNRLIGFIRAILKNKKGAIGIGILSVFTLFAVIPWAFTPYDPIKDVGLAGSMAAPSWIRYLPGGEGYSENILLLNNPGFNDAGSLNELVIECSKMERIHYGFSSSIGYPKGSGPGSIFVTYVRSEKISARENTIVRVSKRFVYPYKAAPERFTGSLAFFVEGTVSDVPVQISFFIMHEEEDKFFTIKNESKRIVYLWNASGTPLNSPMLAWGSTISAVLSAIDSRSESLKIFLYGYIDEAMTKPYWHYYYVRPESDLFDNGPHNFTVGVELSFLDKGKSEGAYVIVYLDDFQFQTFGTAYGLLGTDHYGRDLFTQLVYGTRISLYVGLLASFIGVVIGLIVGLAAGYLGRVVDEILMRFSDMLLVIPTLPLLIVLVAILGPTLNNLILLIGFLGWMGFARVVRSQVLSLRERPFVEAAKAAGAGSAYIMFRHILPNILALVYVTLATSVPGAVVAEASLSWLGFYDPTTMSWGRMLYEAQQQVASYSKWWWVIPPGVCIALIALSFILIGFAMDEILNPRLRERR